MIADSFESVESLVKGATGFAAGMLVCFFGFFKFVMPKCEAALDRNTKATTDIAESVRNMATQVQGMVAESQESRRECLREILEEMKKRNGHTETHTNH